MYSRVGTKNIKNKNNDYLRSGLKNNFGLKSIDFTVPSPDEITIFHLLENQDV